MTSVPPSVEARLRNELSSWLCCALANVVALPATPTRTQWDRTCCAQAISRTRDSLEMVRQGALECVVAARSQPASTSLLTLGELVIQLCAYLEEEVNTAEAVLVTPVA